MKKLILLLSLVILTSCSSSHDDDSNANTKNAYFNPPAWIIGTWKSDIGTTFIFTKDNMSYQINGGITTSLNDQANMVKNSGGKVSVTEDKTESDYTVNYKLTVDGTITYSFKKSSNSQIISTGMFNGTYTKQ